uniref:Uncharacterized protein n=1 Tax=Amphimedon queenslandica TaxID=400682 RepID=A0A1X7VJV5_AMPQE
EAGHQINLNCRQIEIKGWIAAVSADNPASCSLGGFKEGGRAKRLLALYD